MFTLSDIDPQLVEKSGFAAELKSFDEEMTEKELNELKSMLTRSKTRSLELKKARTREEFMKIY